MPRLKLSSRESDGPFVTTSGQVMSGAGSSGQQVWTGRRLRSMSAPWITTCWQAALLAPTVLGFIDSTLLASGISSSASAMLRGGSGWRSEASSSPTSRRLLASRRSTPPMVTPIAMRFTVPNRLTSTGMSEREPSARIGCSKITAGPFSARSRVWISVISSTVETGSRTRTSSPSDSRRLMNSRSER